MLGWGVFISPAADSFACYNMRVVHIAKEENCKESAKHRRRCAEDNP